MSDLEQFRDAIRSVGLEPPAEIDADGQVHRFASNGKRGDDAGWYVLHGDSIPAGAFGCWRTGISETWRADVGRDLTPAEEAAHRSRVELMQREREAEHARRRAEAKAKAHEIWNQGSPVSANHAYLVKKNVKPHGARNYDDTLVLPVRDSKGELHSLQFINGSGEKRFLTGGRVGGCYFSIGKVPRAEGQT